MPGDPLRHHSIGDLHRAGHDSIPKVSLDLLPSLRVSTSLRNHNAGRRIAINPTSSTPEASQSFNFDEPPRPRFRIQPPYIPFFILLPLHLLVHLATLIPYYQARRQKGSFLNNTVRTSRYTVLSFVPYQLLAQFSKIANLYFLGVSAIQLMPDISPTGKYTTILPLAVFVGLAMCREAWDDWQRKKQDNADNNMRARRLRNEEGDIGDGGATVDGAAINGASKSKGDDVSIAINVNGSGEKSMADDSTTWQSVRWQDLTVGDVVCVKDREVLPADVVLLATNSPEGACYIETASLDGETALKQKQALSMTNDKLKDARNVAAFQGTIHAETPTDNLYRFEAYLQSGSATDSTTRHPLTISNFLPRGSILRNSSYIIGVVIYTGEDTKIRRNANTMVVTKAPELDTRTNWIVGSVFIILLGLTTACIIGWGRSNDAFLNENSVWYLWDEVPPNVRSWWGTMAPEMSGGPFPHPHDLSGQPPNDDVHDLMPKWKQFLSFLILLNTLIPISLYVTMEIIKIVQAYYIHMDLDMYCPDSDTPAQARTSNLNEDLGQVQYVFTDKTGTLTENMMVFKRLSVGGKWFVHRPPGGGILQGGAGCGPSVLVDPDPSEVGVETTCSLMGRVVEANKVSEARERAEDGHGPAESGSTAYIPVDILQRAVDLIEAMALCHSAVLETMAPAKDGTSPPQPVYTSSSPDDTALVAAAHEMQFSMRGRTINTITLNIFNSPDPTTYTILHTLEFSSARKRMSVIVRYPHQDHRILLICKGADSTILDRLCDISELFDDEREILDTTLTHVADFAGQGLRTLLYACRVIDEVEYEHWCKEYVEASAAMERREEMMESVASRIERGMILMGATAIEDKLQPGVGVTIEKLARAGMKVWMLTGDKRETAINIGYTCRLVKPWSEVIEVGGDNMDEIVKSIERGLERCWIVRGGKKRRSSKGVTLTETRAPSFPGTACASRSQPPHIVVVITGDTLLKLEKQHTIAAAAAEACVVKSVKRFWQKPITPTTTTNDLVPTQPLKINSYLEAFLDIGILSDGAICCRFSPAQKALIVSSMRKRIKYRHAHPYRPANVSPSSDPPPSLWSRWKAFYNASPSPSNVTLAIGDGANDIPMLQSAHVGIGITGREGLAASRASDYSFAQFRFLQPLLLIHGRYSYVRISFFICGTFYKCFTLYLTQIVYQRFCGWTGQSLYEQWTLALFNIAFSIFPVLVGGMFGKDLNKATLLEVPELYGFGQYNAGLNGWKFCGWIFAALRHATITVIVPINMYQGFYPFGRTLMLKAQAWLGYETGPPSVDSGGPWGETSLLPFGFVVYTVALFVITMKVSYDQSYITVVHHAASIGSLFLWFVWSQIYFTLYPKMGSFGEEVHGVLSAMYPTLLSRLLLLPVLGMLALGIMDYAWNAWLWLFRGVEVGSKMFKVTEEDVEAMKNQKRERKRLFGWITKKKQSQRGVGENPGADGKHPVAGKPSDGITASRRKQLNEFNIARKKAAVAVIHWRQMVEEVSNNKPRDQIDWNASVRWWQRWERENGVGPSLDPYQRLPGPEKPSGRASGSSELIAMKTARMTHGGAFESLGRGESDSISIVRPAAAVSTLRKHTVYKRKSSVPALDHSALDQTDAPPVPQPRGSKAEDVATIV
ncbi:hypothetical protein HDV00_012303 [Rhizophlyctis rosea]|nr:hypothetical protein HDV00_012303 [Rhizophlyctis rosea]